MRYIVSTPKAVVSGLSTVFFWGYAILYLVQGSVLPFLVFGALGCLFAYQLWKNAAYVVIDRETISQRFFGLRCRSLPWDRVREVGVIGEAVFSHGKKGRQRSGEKYIYFSPVAHNEKSRFQMIVNWPPRDGSLYMEYTPEALERAQLLWNGPIKYYNAEDLYPNTED